MNKYSSKYKYVCTNSESIGLQNKSLIITLKSLGTKLSLHTNILRICISPLSCSPVYPSSLLCCDIGCCLVDFKAAQLSCTNFTTYSYKIWIMMFLEQDMGNQNNPNGKHEKKNHHVTVCSGILMVI